LLREASRDLSWLLTRKYATNSALKIVGDRYHLTARQRQAVARCACDDESRDRRARHVIQTTALERRELWIDGYNVLTSIEAALAGAVILRARDGCYRDMASMHGSYRKVEETTPAIRLLGDSISKLNVLRCRWYLDKPVSNSGRLRAMLHETAEEYGWPWSIELAADPDPILAHANEVVVSADSQILDQAER
jgi:hypothetical protein